MSVPLNFALMPPDENSGPRYLRAGDDYGHLGIGRRTFFRWKGYGADVKDWPPFDQPGELDAWYGRMRGRGVFKHDFPRAVRVAVAAFMGGGQPAPPVVATEVADTVADPLPPGPVIVDEYQGLEHELQQLRSRVASIRLARDASYAEGDRANGDLHDAHYREAFNDLTIAEKRALEVLEKRKMLIARADVEHDLAPRVAGIVVGGMYFYARIAPQLDAVSDAGERLALWRSLWQEHCAPLMQTRFVPDYIRLAPSQLWAECAEWLQSKAPPGLNLKAS